MTNTQATAPLWKTKSMRRARPVGIVSSGSNRTTYDCAICGEQHTVATRNRGTTKHEREFIALHNSERHLQDAIARWLVGRSARFMVARS